MNLECKTYSVILRLKYLLKEIDNIKYELSNIVYLL